MLSILTNRSPSSSPRSAGLTISTKFLDFISFSKLLAFRCLVPAAVFEVLLSFILMRPIIFILSFSICRTSRELIVGLVLCRISILGILSHFLWWVAIFVRPFSLKVFFGRLTP